MSEYNRANQYRQSENYDEAIKIYRELIKKTSTYDIIREYAHTLCEKGQQELEKGPNEAEKSYFEKAIP
jgi:hypothetical protein